MAKELPSSARSLSPLRYACRSFPDESGLWITRRMLKIRKCGPHDPTISREIMFVVILRDHFNTQLLQQLLLLRFLVLLL